MMPSGVVPSRSRARGDDFQSTNANDAKLGNAEKPKCLTLSPPPPGWKSLTWMQEKEERGREEMERDSSLQVVVLLDRSIDAAGCWITLLVAVLIVSC